MIGRHLDEIPVEGCEQFPVLRLVRRTCLAAPGSALETRFELRRVESVKKFDECRARSLRGRNLVSLALGDRLSQPADRIEPATLVLREQIDDQIFNGRASQRGTRIVRIRRKA